MQRAAATWTFCPAPCASAAFPRVSVGALMTQLQRFPEPSSAFPPVLRQVRRAPQYRSMGRRPDVVAERDGTGADHGRRCTIMPTEDNDQQPHRLLHHDDSHRGTVHRRHLAAADLMLRASARTTAVHQLHHCRGSSPTGWRSWSASPCFSVGCRRGGCRSRRRWSGSCRAPASPLMGIRMVAAWPRWDASRSLGDHWEAGASRGLER